MTGFVTFMNATLGRTLRVLLGITLIIFGLLLLGGTVGIVVALVGLLPIALGLWGRCLLEPFALPARRAL